MSAIFPKAIARWLLQILIVSSRTSLHVDQGLIHTYAVGVFLLYIYISLLALLAILQFNIGKLDTNHPFTQLDNVVFFLLFFFFFFSIQCIPIRIVVPLL
jgi:hypothetical protein